MRIEKDFDVPAPRPDTYALLVDLERVAPCIPGGEVGPPEADGSHPAAIAVRLGPMRMNYRGIVRIAERDDDAHRAVLEADVREQRGQGTAKAKMTMAITARGSASRVKTLTDVKLTGRAAQMGRGVVDDVAVRLVAEMTDCIAKRFGGGEADEGDGGGGSAGAGAAPVAKPIRGLRLLLRVLWERIKRLFGRRGG